MAGVTEYLIWLIFLMCCDCSPIKRSTDLQDTSQVANQERIVTLLANQQASLDIHTETENQIVRILEGVTTQIANQAARLGTQTDTQDKMVSLLSNQTVTIDLIATLLKNITGSLNTMITKHDHMEKLLLDKNHLSSFTDNQLASLTTPTPNGITIPSTPENHKATPDQITMQSQVNQDVMTPIINHQQESTTTMTADILRDCSDVALHSNLSQPYTITPYGASRSYTFRCDLETDGGGWTVIQRRFDGSVDFYRDWQDYVDGFGDPYGEYWAGLEFINLLTHTGTGTCMWELRVDLEDFHGTTVYAQYASFRVGNAASNYLLSLGTYSGTAGNGMIYDHNRQFSTRDNNNGGRPWSTLNCAERNKGGWWYDDCGAANLNGKYLGPYQSSYEGLAWHAWKNRFEVLKKSEMKIRCI